MSYSIDERFNQIDEAIEELATGGTPDVLTLYLTKQEASSTYLTQSDASSTYLTQSDAESDYLPLSAGSSKPLTDDLYFNTTSTSINIVLSENNVVKTRFTSATNYAAIDKLDSTGTTTIAGFHAHDGYTWVYGNGPISLKPNGWNSSTGVVAVSTSGTISTPGSIEYRPASSVGNKFSKYTDSTEVAYLYFSPTGYLDIWSKQATQIRTGAGHQSDDTIRFIFNTNGVLTAPGMYTTTRSGSALVIDSSGKIGRTSSLRKYKKDISPITNEDAIKGYDLNPITYTSALEYDLQNTQYGLIAEEVEEVLPNLCTYDTDGNIDGVAYDRVCAILLKQNQLLNERVKELENKLENLEKSL